MYKLIAVDLDGTLLNNNSMLPEINARYIKMARDMGVRLVICSGRSLNSLEYYCREIGVFGQGCYAVGHNGGIVFETESRRLLRDIRMGRDAMLEYVNEMKKFKVDILMYVVERLKAIADTPDIRKYTEISLAQIDHLGDFSELAEDVSKILAIGDNKELLRLEKHMLEFLHIKGRENSCNMFMTGTNLFEISALGADKGSGLRFLAEYLGIGLDEVIACGDYFNDIQMLRVAGLAVAVANAVPTVKAEADYVTEADNNQGAVAEVIQKFILG